MIRSEHKYIAEALIDQLQAPQDEGAPGKMSLNSA